MNDDVMSTDPEAPLSLDAPCWVCERPVGLGDEPGRVPMAMWPEDIWVPCCSVACTDTWFVQEPEAEIARRA